jgi:hypothetical protein
MEVGAEGANADQGILGMHSPPGVEQSAEGQALGSAERQWFEQRIGEDLGNVRLHRGSEVDRALRSQGAQAATLGRDIAMSSAVGAPEKPQGRSVLAHELIHVAQQKGASGPVSESPDVAAERQARTLASSMLLPGAMPAIHRVARPSVMFLTDTSGQHADTASGGITSDLTSPIVVGRTVHFQVDMTPQLTFAPATALGNPYPHYLWNVIDKDSGATVASNSFPAAQPGGTVRTSVIYPRAGHFRVECIYIDPSRGATPAVTLNQDVVGEDPKLAADLSSDSDYSEAERELVDDLRSYVNDAAAGTGPQGITARFLAAILREEIANTRTVPSWLPFGGTNKQARESELSGVDAAIKKQASGQSVPPQDIDHSVGVAQVKLSTAAMAQGLIPWTEADPANKLPARNTIAQNFSALPGTTLTDLYSLLAWPKSNIRTAANYLAKLKNRANRYPSMMRATFGVNERACEIIATEYNVGATNSPEFSAQPSSYGQTIWKNMSSTVVQKVFPNT